MRAPSPWILVVAVAAAIAGPMLLWYFAGAQEAERHASRVEAQARQSVDGLEARLGARVDARLEALLASESRRPWYHYQPYFHDPRSVPETISVAPSPISEAPGDPLIAGYFQVDENGRLSSPGATPTGIEWKSEALLASAPGGPFEPSRLSALDAVQNFSQQLIVDNARAPGRPPLEGVAVEPADGHVEFGATPLRWARLDIDGAQALVALRTVLTPQGRLVQGFVVDRGALDAWTVDSLHARPEPYSPTAHATLYLVSGTWRVRVVGLAPQLLDADARASEIRAAFRQRFALRASVVTLVGLGALAALLQADRLARRREEFAAAAAHELRTPLASLRLHAEMIAEGLGDPARTRDYARSIADESRRLGRVVDNVLGYTCLELGSVGVDLRDVDLVSTVREMVDSQRLVLERAGMEVTFEAEHAEVRARVDTEALAGILGNLLDNAEKHSRSSAIRRVEVRVTREPAVIVSDGGPGIPARRRRAAFQPFAHGWRRRGGPSGLGLGLSLARSMARAQGGDLELLAESPGGGAQFRIKLARGSTPPEGLPAAR